MNNKKLLAATLISTALFAGSAANAEDVSNWEDLTTKLQAGGADLKVVSDSIVGNSILSVSGKTNALNLNNKTLSGNNTNPSGLEFVNNSSITLTGGGTISNFNRPDVNPASVDGNEFGAVQIGSGSTLTMIGGDWTFSGNNAGLGALNSWNGSVEANVNKIVFDGNQSDTQGGGFRHDVSDSAYNSTVARITASEIEFKNNEIGSAAVVGSGAGAMNSRGTMELLGDKITFTNNSMNATVAEGRRYKVGGGAVANQSGETTEGQFNATMAIGKDANSIVTFSGNSSSTSGGAIMNRAVDTDGNAILTINGNTTFSNNTATQNGGAIYNVAQNGHNATVSLNGTSTFTGNSAQYGGAIANIGARIEGVTKSTSDGNATLNLSNTTFTGNTATARGGAIYNAGTLTVDKGVFDSNRSSSYGGAIFSSGQTTINNSKFTNNYSDYVGGAITTLAGTTSNLIVDNTTFENNHTRYDGGAIGNYSGLSITKSTFKNNTADYLADSEGNYTILVNDDTAIGGGAIALGAVSATSIGSISETSFIDNKSGSYGGAIGTRFAKDADNSAAKLDISADFSGNEANISGGAIYNTFYTNNGLGKGDGVTVTGTFDGNKAGQYGGAVYNDASIDKSSHVGGVMTITDSTFTNNTAGTNGGAIYNQGTLTLAGTNTFTGNTANGVANDIYNVGTLNIGGTATLNGGIDGLNTSVAANIVNITGGVTTVGAKLTNQTVSVNGGELHLAGTGTAATAVTDSTFSVANGATINTIDGVINDYASQITLADGANIKVDTNLSAVTADKFTIASGDSVTVKEIKVLTDASGDNTEVKIADNGNVSIADGVAAYTTTNKYTVVGNNANNGLITLTKDGVGGLKKAADDTHDSSRDNVTYTLTGVDNTTEGAGNSATIENADMTIQGAGNSDTQKVVLSNDLNVGATATDTSTLTLNEAKLEKGTTAGKIVVNDKATLTIKDSIIGVTIQNKGTLISDPTTYHARVENAGTATFNNDTFENITETKNGAAIYTTGQLTLLNTNFNNNTTNQSGGAVYDNKANLTISGSNFTGNSSTGNTWSTYGGGAIYATGQAATPITVSIADTTFESNTSKKDGGAIYLSNAEAVLNNVTIGSNGKANTTNASGAGLRTIGTTHSTLISNSNINYNAATSNGGGILSGSLMTVDNTTVSHNTANNGAGIYVNEGALTVQNGSNLSNNSATTVGGAVYSRSAGNVIVDDSIMDGNIAKFGAGIYSSKGNVNVKNGSTISNNIATVNGGGINLESAAALSVADSTFDSNSADYGGAVAAVENTGTTSIISSTIQNNTAGKLGGAIFAQKAGDITIKGSTFTNNKATETGTFGGAIFANNTNLFIDKDSSDNKSIFTGNIAGNGGAIGIGSSNALLTVKNSEFKSNKAVDADGQGGAIIIMSDAKVGAIIDNSIFGGSAVGEGNSSTEGGGAIWFGVDGAITNSTFIANSATGAASDSEGGGAIFVGGGSDLNIINSQFTSNTSAAKGGAISTRPDTSSGSSSLYITGDGTAATEFNGNTAAIDGGAIWTEVKTVIANTNFTNNTATSGNGGAISHTAADANRLLEIIADGTNVAFSGNTANSVANDIYNTGRLDLVATGSTDTITFGGGITGDGNMYINKLGTDNNSYKILDGTTVTDKTITTAAGTVIFNGDVTTGTLNLGGGTLTNNKTLTITGNDSTAIANEFNGTINGDGDLVIGNGTNTVIASSLGTLSNKNITINAKASLSADPDNLAVTNTGKTLTNNGELSLTAGTIAFSVSGTGHTDIVGNDVKFDTASRKINQQINIMNTSGATDDHILVANGANIGGKVVMNDLSETKSTILRLTGGEMSYNIEGVTVSEHTTYGDLEIKDNVTFSGTSADVASLAITAGKTLTNNNTITVHDDLTNGGTISNATTATLNLLDGEAGDENTMKNAGSISGGNVNIGSATENAYVENTGSGSITGNITIAQGSTLKSDSSKTGTNAIKNDGTLIFNNAADGTIAQNIVKSTAGTGVVEIAAADGIKISLNGKTISDNSVKLSSGIFDITDGTNADLSAPATLIANGGTLSVQDSKTGTINLGTVDTSTSALNVMVDVDLGDESNTSVADVIKVTTTGSDLTKGINLSSIKWVDSTKGHKTPDSILIADDSIGNKVSIAQTRIDTAGGVGNLLLSKTYTEGTGTKLEIAHSDLENAITSSITEKVYAAAATTGEDLSSATNLTLGGTSLSVSSENAYTIKGGDKAITLANDGQTLSIKSDETATGAKFVDFTNTVIDNTKGGTVNLKNVTISNTSANPDIINDSVDAAKGVFLEGNNRIGSIKDSAGTAAKGQTTISSGVSNITTIAQNSVTVGTDSNTAILNIRGDGSTATTPSLTANTLTINKKTSDNTMSEVENSGTITVANTIINNGKLTNNENATITATNGITNTGAIFNTAAGSSIAAAITNNGTGQIETNVDNFTGTITNNASPTSTEQHAGLNLYKGTSGVLSQAITGTGTISVLDDITVAATTGSITQDTVNVIGKLSTPATLTNKGTIVADKINASNGNALVLNGGSTTQADSIILNSTSLTVNDNAALKNEDASGVSNIKATNSNINLNANTANTTFNASLAADSFGNSINTNSASGNTVTIDSAIGAIDGALVAINAQSGNLALTKDTINSLTNANKINMGSGTKLTLDSTGGNAELKAGIQDAGGYDSVIIAGANTVSVSSEIANAVNGINVNNGSTLALLDTAETNENNVTLGDGSKLTASGTGEMFINGDIKGNSNTTSTFDVNKSTTGSNDADVIVDGKISDVAINVGAGSLILGQNATLENSTATSIESGAKLGTMNKKIQEVTAPITFASGSKLDVDADVAKGISDSFSNTLGAAPKLDDMYIAGIEKIARDSASMNLTDKIGIAGLTASDALASNIAAKYSNVLTPIRKMNASIQTTDDGLLLNITGTGNSYDDFNPSVFAAPVAAQLGGYLTQLNSYDQAFRNMDMYMLMTRKERQALKFRNKMASTQNVSYDPTNQVTDSAAGWVRPYATFERVALHNGPRVSNVMYGTFIGGESELKDLGHGWDGMWGAYVGYNGSHQAYQGNSIYQNGGTLGLVGMAYKDNFFIGGTINTGAGAADASTMYGSETMTMLMAGIAAKTGYNWELADGKFIIQPSLLAAYSFVNTFDYTNAAGVRMDSDPLHAITIEPGLKLIGNLKNGWQPYIGASVVINIMDRTRFMANDVSLPNLGVNPYAKYGLGVRKTWGDRFSGFLQAFFTSGGRDGVGFQGGFRWNIGKAGSGHISRDAQTPQLKQTTISLNNKKSAK